MGKKMRIEVPFPLNLFPVARITATAVGAATVEVDENVARFSALAGADNAAVFQFIHDARGTGVTQAQAALHEGDARFLFAADDFHALLDEVFVLVAAAFAVEVA